MGIRKKRSTDYSMTQRLIEKTRNRRSRKILAKKWDVQISQVAL